MNSTSNEKLYSSRDLARIASSECEGCGECCRNMGESIHLDPYDAYMLAQGLNKPFADLIGHEVALHEQNKLLIPHLVMSSSCAFLGADGRCKVHSFRPGLCRLFPLGRDFTGGKVSYFVLENACPKASRTKVRIEKWLDIPNLRFYEAYKVDWHRFSNDLQGHLLGQTDDAYIKRINDLVINTFFLKPYEGANFYLEFNRRLLDVRRMFH